MFFYYQKKWQNLLRFPNPLTDIEFQNNFKNPHNFPFKKIKLNSHYNPYTLITPSPYNNNNEHPNPHTPMSEATIPAQPLLTNPLGQVLALQGVAFVSDHFGSNYIYNASLWELARRADCWIQLLFPCTQANSRQRARLK